MSNWLGFSLTPHLRIDEDAPPDFEPSSTDQQNNTSTATAADEEKEQTNCFSAPNTSSSVMPLRSDGSLCVQGKIKIKIKSK